MGLPPLDFESSASTSFTTPAWICLILHLPSHSQGELVQSETSLWLFQEIWNGGYKSIEQQTRLQGQGNNR